MTKNSKAFGLFIFFILLMSAPLIAQEAELSPERVSLFRISIIVGGAVIVLASAAGAFCQAKAISSACEGISRNPGGAPTIRFILIFGLVLIEALVIYALLITIIILMVQWGNYS